MKVGWDKFSAQSLIINFKGEDQIEEWEDMLLHEGGVIAQSRTYLILSTIPLFNRQIHHSRGTLPYTVFSFMIRVSYLHLWDLA